MTERKYYCKDMTFKCPKCGKSTLMSELKEQAYANIYDYEDITYPDGFNPFRKDRADRITILYDCYCPHCNAKYEMYIVCKAFAVEIVGDEMEEVFSEYTEEINH